MRLVVILAGLFFVLMGGGAIFLALAGALDFEPNVVTPSAVSVLAGIVLIIPAARTAPNR